ncbi:hypothetical protein MNBD_NITROSPINAE04-382 [hydrothermal vent metagenome]|uniref:Uncharacterized protein n=1 Tax=hydrothermal vent metagenome TaxID=652676 RepID=A0A3B1C3N8_9ZZZZ
MARKPAKTKSAVKPKPGDETAPLTMKEKVAKLKKSRQDAKKDGWLPDKKAALSNRRGIASSRSLRTGKQR